MLVPSCLIMIPSSSLIDLKTFKISSSEAIVMSIGSVSSESISKSISSSSSDSSSSESMSKSISTSSISSSSESISISMSTSSSDCSSISTSLVSFSASFFKDSFTSSEISSFIVEASIPFAFSATTCSKFFIWSRASSTNDFFSVILLLNNLTYKYIHMLKNSIYDHQKH